MIIRNKTKGKKLQQKYIRNRKQIIELKNKNRIKMK